MHSMPYSGSCEAQGFVPFSEGGITIGSTQSKTGSVTLRDLPPVEITVPARIQIWLPSSAANELHAYGRAGDQHLSFFLTSVGRYLPSAAVAALLRATPTWWSSGASSALLASALEVVPKPRRQTIRDIVWECAPAGVRGLFALSKHARAAHMSLARSLIDLGFARLDSSFAHVGVPDLLHYDWGNLPPAAVADYLVHALRGSLRIYWNRPLPLRLTHPSNATGFPASNISPAACAGARQAPETEASKPSSTKASKRLAAANERAARLAAQQAMADAAIDAAYSAPVDACAAQRSELLMAAIQLTRWGSIVLASVPSPAPHLVTHLGPRMVALEPRGSGTALRVPIALTRASFAVALEWARLELTALYWRRHPECQRVDDPVFGRSAVLHDITANGAAFQQLSEAWTACGELSPEPFDDTLLYQPSPDSTQGT